MYIDNDREHNNFNERINEAPATTHLNKSTINKQKEFIVNNFPDNDVLLRNAPAIQRTHPGNSTYANITKRGKKIVIISSSICKRINMNKFHDNLKNGNAIKRCFSGATASQFLHFIMPTLEEEKPDTVILQIGTNNFTKKRQNAQEILKEILDVVDLCQHNGVNDVFVSSVINRPSFQSKVDELNRYLDANAREHNFTFIDNSNIQEIHLWRDKVHLNNKGIMLLANNFLNILNCNDTNSGYDKFF